MCVAFIAWQAHSDWPLIIASNRDEFHARPSEALAWWEDAPVLGGRDAVAGGGWFAVNKAGAVGLVTNVRDAVDAPAEAPSRGTLLSRWLLEQTEPCLFAAQLAAEAAEHSGYNLLFGNRAELWHHSNRGAPAQALQAGVHGLSNAALNSPWPKVQRGKRLLSGLLQGDWQSEDLFALLADQTPGADDELPNTGVSKPVERLLSPIFIAGPQYGTRASTLLLLHRSGELLMQERRFAPDGVPMGESEVVFGLSAA